MKSISKLLALFGAAALLGGVSQAQTTTNQISLTTFGPDNIPPWGFTYFYNNSGLGTAAYNTHYYAPDDTGSTNGMFQFTFDISALDGTVNWGTGTGGPLMPQPVDPTVFISGDRDDYILTFDARVDGLLEGQTSANAEFQTQIGIPDTNGVNATYQVNTSFQATTNWQTFRFKLSDGSLATGDGKAYDEDFAARHDQIKSLQFGVNLHEPFRAFGYDADNALYLDNIKLEVIDKGATNNGPQPTYAKTILDWNLDDKGLWYSYGPYDWSANSTHATYTLNRIGNDLGVDGSSGWALLFDNTAFSDAVPAWAGGGTGGGGPVDFTQFDSPDLANYRISFDARAIGLAEGRDSTTAALQLFLNAPDDTLQPADSNTDGDTLVQLNIPVPGVALNWNHYSISLKNASIGGGSKDNFAAYFNKLNGMNMQWQLETTGSWQDWGYDSDNGFVVDNIKMERLVTGLSISYSQQGIDLVLTWPAATDGVTTLQSSDKVDGPYTNVTTTGNTYTETMSGNKFFRLLWQAPQ